MVPSYIQDFIPPLVREILDYLYLLIKLVFHRNLVIPSAIRLWTSLDDNFKNILTLSTFKRHIFSKLIIEHVPPYFTVENGYISVLHARLRNKCSRLNSGLFRNHIHNNP